MLNSRRQIKKKELLPSKTPSLGYTSPLEPPVITHQILVFYTVSTVLDDQMSPLGHTKLKSWSRDFPHHIFESANFRDFF